MNIQQRMKLSVANNRDDVFIRADFKKFGSSAQISRALIGLVNEGKLVKVGRAVYVKARPSSISGNPVPTIPLAQIAQKALIKLGVSFSLGNQQAAYQRGETTQIPIEIAFNTGIRRISRKLALGNKVVHFENNHA
jgi:hypothetical protein